MKIPRPTHPWIKTNMAPLRGWGRAAFPSSCAFRPLEDHDLHRSAAPDRISAPWVIDGPVNGELFTLYVEQVLAPTLAKGELVILDNLGCRKGKSARNAIRATGAHLLFLPPYSPDLNPIEQVFAKLKHLMRAAQPRDVETWRKVGRTPRSLLQRGVRQLPQKLRICFRIKTARSRIAVAFLLLGARPRFLGQCPSTDDHQYGERQA